MVLISGICQSSGHDHAKTAWILRASRLNCLNMRKPADTKKPSTVEREVCSVYVSLFPQADPSFVRRCFGWTMEAFQGRYRDYQAIDALYHDLEHTLQGTLCLARLLHNRHRANATPLMTERMFQLTLLAI